MNKRQRIVVVGHGMVGHRFAQAAVERGLTETHDIVVFGEEPRAAYDRVALTSWFGHARDGQGSEALSLLPGGEYDDPRVRLVLDSVVTEIDRDARTVTVVSPPSAARSRDGRRSALLDQREDVGAVTVHDYDVLVLATGAAPFVPPVEGRGKDGCFVYRTIEDLQAIKAASESATSGV
ncbi:MAG TPA: FAD-dependent oxidoreductase, partial [Nocardioides sp.]